jgi:hypothetical protein
VHLTTLLIAQLLTTPLTRLIAPERGFDDDGLHAQRHRHSEFIRFLNAVEREVPAGKLIHTVLDNYATHTHPKVLAWLSRHPRWTFTLDLLRKSGEFPVSNEELDETATTVYKGI